MATKSLRRWGALLEVALTLALAGAIGWAVQAWAVKPYKIPSGSMEPTLDIGQRILVSRLLDPAVGDVVVFHPPAFAEGNAGSGPSHQCAVDFSPLEPCPLAAAKQSSGTDFVKRIVAGPGDTIAVREGHVILNGELQKEPFITPCPPMGRACALPKAIEIPLGHWFMMGDNRGESDDSRYWGPIPGDWIIGKAIATYWPPNRIGGV